MISHTEALIRLHLAVLLFGASGLIGRAVSSPPLVITCVRSLVASVVLWGFVRLDRSPGRLRPHLAILLVSGVLLAVHWWTFFAAIQRGGVALGLLTFASYPAFAAVLGWWILGEKILHRDLAAGVLVFAGLALIITKLRIGSLEFSAALFGVLSGLTFALLTLANRRVIQKLPAFTLVAIQTGVAGLVLLPLAAGGFRAVSAFDWALLGVLGVACTGFAHWCFTSSLTHVRVATAGITAALEPVYGIGLAWLLLHERPSAEVSVGGLLILAGALASAWKTSE